MTRQHPTEAPGYAPAIRLRFMRHGGIPWGAVLGRLRAFYLHGRPWMAPRRRSR